MIICHTVPKMRVGCNFYFSFWATFCPFPKEQPKESNFLKKEKIPGDIIILQICTKNYDHMVYGS